MSKYSGSKSFIICLSLIVASITVHAIGLTFLIYVFMFLAGCFGAVSYLEVETHDRRVDKRQRDEFQDYENHTF